VARYRALVEQEPENSVLLYLLSRVLDDPDESIAMLRRAAAVPKPTAYAPFGLAYRHVLDGDFQAALTSIEQALRLEPKKTQFKVMRVSALYGLKQYETLEKEAGDLLRSPEPDLAAFYEHVYRLAKLGRVAAAKSEIPKLVTKLAWDEEAAPTARAYLESAIAVAMQDRAAYLAAAAHIKDASWDLGKSLVQGNLDDALRVAKAAPDEVDQLEHLSLYVLLQRGGRADAAKAHLESAAEDLAAGDSDQRRWAAWLRGDEAPDPRLATHACEDPDTHGVLLCALAHKFPARADEYLARAAAMKVKDTFYTLVLGL
jgi:hypothetical protein